MEGETLAWGIALVAIFAAGGSFVWQRRRGAALRTTLAEAEKRAAEAAELAAENRDLNHRLAAGAHALETARNTADQLVQSFDFLPLPVWRRRADLTIQDCNPAYSAALESDRATVIRENRTLGRTAHGDSGRALAELARAARTPQTESVHVVIAGTRRLIEITEAAIADGGTIGMAVDVTDREDLEREHDRHLAAHREVLENLSTAIAIYGADSRLQFFNSAFVRLWKLDATWLATGPSFAEALEDLRARRLLPEYVDFQAFKQSRVRLFTSLLEPVEELVYIPDGTTLRTHISPHPLGGLMFAYEDVTDSLALERSYNTLIAVQRATLDNLYEGVAVIGSDGRLKLTNPSYGRIWGLPADLLSGEPHIAEVVERTRAYFNVGAEWPSFRDRLIARLTDREPRKGRTTRTDGSILDFAMVPLPDGAVLLSYVDVSDSVRVEQALRLRNDALEAADRLKSEFISNISYELRTPLNTIIGFAEILSQQYFGKLNARQREYCRGIAASSEQLLTVINDILDLASIEAGRMALERSLVRPRALLDQVAQVMQESARAQSLDITVDCPKDLAALEADERRLKQALCNLVSNAIKFTPEGGAIQLLCDVEDGHALISVRDTGVGIRAEDRERVLQSFERGRAPSDDARRDGFVRGSGAGLGLALTKRIVELHGGRLTIDSTPNRGTTVTCFLPLVPNEQNARRRIDA